MLVVLILVLVVAVFLVAVVANLVFQNNWQWILMALFCFAEVVVAVVAACGDQAVADVVVAVVADVVVAVVAVDIVAEMP